MPRRPRPGSRYYGDSDDDSDEDEIEYDHRVHHYGGDETANLKLKDLTATVAELRQEIQEIKDYMPLLRDLPIILPLLKSVHEKVVVGTKGKELAVRQATSNKIKTKRFVIEMGKMSQVWRDAEICWSKEQTRMGTLMYASTHHCTLQQEGTSRSLSCYL